MEPQPQYAQPHAWLRAQVGDAWARLVALVPVAQLLEAVQPSIDFAWRKYLEAHDTIVATPTYSRCGVQPQTLWTLNPIDSKPGGKSMPGKLTCACSI
jgi:hypothetical protein